MWSVQNNNCPTGKADFQMRRVQYTTRAVLYVNEMLLLTLLCGMYRLSYCDEVLSPGVVCNGRQWFCHIVIVVEFKPLVLTAMIQKEQYSKNRI